MSKKPPLTNLAFSRPQDCNRIDRLCRSGGAFSIAKRSFAAENILLFLIKKVAWPLFLHAKAAASDPAAVCFFESEDGMRYVYFLRW
jgi:hypothetical protein